MVDVGVGFGVQGVFGDDFQNEVDVVVEIEVMFDFLIQGKCCEGEEFYDGQNDYFVVEEFFVYELFLLWVFVVWFFVLFIVVFIGFFFGDW